MADRLPIAHALPDHRVAVYVGGSWKSLTIAQAQHLRDLLEQAITDAGKGSELDPGS